MNRNIDEMTHSSRFGKLILECFGFSILNNGKELDVGKAKSADFLVSYKDTISIVEVKLKISDKGKIKERNEILSKGQVYESDEYKHTNEAIHTILRKANSQIRQSTKVYNTDFNILLMILSGCDANIRLGQIINDLYGQEYIFDEKSKKCIPCYFYNHNIFHRMECVDVVLITGYLDDDMEERMFNSNMGFTLCLNPFSEKSNLISNLFSGKENCTFINPQKEVEEKQAFILNKDDWDKIKQYQEKLHINDMEARDSPHAQVLSKKYGKCLIPIQVNMDLSMGCVELQ